MAFTTPCFIRKNTPELRNKLEELGYTYIPNGRGAWFIPIEELQYLVTYPRSGCYQGVNGHWHERDFDCRTNEELFLALVALRDDSDKNQWFVNKNGYFEMCFNDKVENYLCGYGVRKYRQIDETYHKATVVEIIEHFKDK